MLMSLRLQIMSWQLYELQIFTFLWNSCKKKLLWLDFLENLQQCSVCDLAKKFSSYWETTNSNPPRPIKLSSQSRAGVRPGCAIYQPLCQNAGPKPFCWCQAGCFDFCSSNFLLQGGAALRHKLGNNLCRPAEVHVWYEQRSQRKQAGKEVAWKSYKVFVYTIRYLWTCRHHRRQLGLCPKPSSCPMHHDQVP